MNTLVVSYSVLKDAAQFFVIYYYNAPNGDIILGTNAGVYIFYCNLNQQTDIDDFVNNYQTASIEVFKEDDVVAKPALDKYTISRYDLGDIYIYLGKAVPGSLSSEPVWKISRFEFDINGNPINEKKSLYGVIWDDRASLLYI